MRTPGVHSSGGPRTSGHDLGHRWPLSDPGRTRRQGDPVYRQGVLSLPRLVVPALLVAGVSLLPAAPASADVTGTTTTDDVVLYNHCQQHPISYDLGVAPGTPLWLVEIQVFDPKGMTSEGTSLNSVDNPPTSGTLYHEFCGSEEPGTYTVRAVVTETVLALQTHYALPVTSFEVRPAATRTTLSDSSTGHGRHRLRVRVAEESEHGFDKADGVTVRIERRVHGQWKKLPGTSLTTVRGRVTTTLSGHAGQRVRAVVPARHNYAASVSKPVTL
jgi:hypothetical protein